MRDVLFELWCALLSLVSALALGGLLLLYIGESPALVYMQLLKGALGSRTLLGETIAATTPYLFCGLSLAVAFRAGLFNIGAEGQLFLGAMAAAIVGRWLSLPIIGLLGLLAASFLAGMLWGLLPAWLKNRFGVHEVISTLMLNYIAFALCAYLLRFPSIRLDAASPQTADVAKVSQWFSFSLLGLPIDPGFCLGVLLALLLWHIIQKTQFGFALRVAGAQPEAARAAGISFEYMTLAAFALSGGIAGLAGGCFVAAPGHPYFQMGFSPGWGYWGIALALLARNHPVGIILAAALFGILETGSGLLDTSMSIPRELVYTLEALMILMLSSRLFHRLLSEENTQPQADEEPAHG